jgi:hypothetical protein
MRYVGLVMRNVGLVMWGVGMVMWVVGLVMRDARLRISLIVLQKI